MRDMPSPQHFENGNSNTESYKNRKSSATAMGSESVDAAQVLGPATKESHVGMSSDEKPRKRKKKSSGNGALPLRKAEVPSLQQQLITAAYGSPSELVASGIPQPESSVSSVVGQHEVHNAERWMADARHTQQEDVPGPPSAENNVFDFEKSGETIKTGASKSSNAQSAHSKTPPIKMMKLRTDGKLRSPKGSEQSQPKSKRGRKPAAAVTKEEKVVVLRYNSNQAGQDSIRERIVSILSGALRVPDSRKQDQAQPCSRPLNPPKKTHPFFLGQAKASQSNVHNEDPPKHPSITSSPHKKQVLSMPRPAFTTTFVHNRLPRYPNANLPPWPSGDMVHNRGLDEAFLRLSVRPSDNRLARSAGKLKNAEIIVDPREDVLMQNRKSVEVNCPDRTASSSHPTRRIISRKELKHAVLQQLSQVRPHHASHQLSIQQMLEMLPNTLSAFDKFECENRDWATKYAPKCTGHVLQRDRRIELLRDWLLSLTVNNVESGNVRMQVLETKRKRKRRKQSDLDGFIVAEEEQDDDLDLADSNCDSDHSATNSVSAHRYTEQVTRPWRKSALRRLTPTSLRNSRAVVLSGPNGCGKTASIYAVAQELGFEVFEINSGSRRSGKDLLDRVGDMTRNHLVNRVSSDEELSEAEEGSHVQEEIDSGRQSTMQAFFKTNPSKAKAGSRRGPKQKQQPTIQPPAKKAKSQKQSLILLEEVDVLFEEDKNFWNTVVSLLGSSRRPIVMTCTDETLLPAAEFHDCSILRLASPLPDDAADYLLLAAAQEGHLLPRKAVKELYHSTRNDLRSSIHQLQFWCQMALKDPKGGLDWMLVQSRHNGSTNGGEDTLRVISEGTYQTFMGLMSEDQSTHEDGGFDRELELLREAIDEWSYDVEDWTEWSDGAAPSGHALNDSLSLYHKLCSVESFYEAISSSDVLFGSRLFTEDALDTSQNEIREKTRINYTTGHPLLQADLVRDEAAISKDIVLTIKLCSRNVAFNSSQPLDRDQLCRKVISPKTGMDTLVASHRDLLATAFEPLAPFQSDSAEGMPNSILGSENRFANLATEIAPYVRSIVTYDLQLGQERLRLSNLLSEGGRAGKKQRTTRASRAALEGGSKANTRRERWFTYDLNYPLMLETGGKGWQDALSAIKEESSIECASTDASSVDAMEGCDDSA